jgi:hypothetical protein
MLRGPRKVIVDCPICAEMTDLTIPDGTPLGTALKVACPAGHVFRIRVGQTGIDILPEGRGTP